MKELIILRHAKSSWEHEGLSDHDRSLNKRGVKNAQSIGEFLNAITGRPDLIISSSATRASQTARIIADEIGYPINEIKSTRELYLAWINDILKTISSLPKNIDSCIIVGHNPGLTDLINYFGIKLDSLPTASAACIEFETTQWDNLSKENSVLKWFQLARDL